MLRISNKKLAQSYLDELAGADFGEDPPDEFGLPGFINNDNYSDYLADELDNEGEEQEPQKPPSVPHEPPAEQGPKPVEYENATKLVKDGIQNGEVISFDYTNRHGMFCGHRTVEPHYIFLARSTGNLILVSWDRNYGAVRCFLTANIHPYGVRYEGERFAPRPEIMVGT